MKRSISIAVLLGASGFIACSSATEGSGGQGGKTGKGGASSGGATQGGTSSGGMSFGGATSGGNGNGGTVNGGAANGGAANGGTANGGSASGGVSNGGVSNGGSANGGSANGGSANGGSANGGVANGGSSSGGSATGGSANGGSANGGVANGGVANGGVANGGSANGGVANGGSANGGSANGGVGGAATGGTAAGGNGGAGGTNPVGQSDLPVPAGAANVPKPSGAVGGFKVLNWANFKGAISFTFDDALQSQLDNYSKFKAVGVRMTFYLVCNNDGSKTGWKTIAQDGNELGNHTMHHCNANGTNCGWGTFTNTSAEFDDCTAHLKSAFGVKDVYTSASPMGDTGWDTPASTRFLANRGVQDNANGVTPNDTTSVNPFELPCHVASTMEKAVGGFNNVTDSARANGKWRIILNHSVGNNDGYNPVDANEVAAAMTYAKSLGDVWVDSVVNVAAYWRAQKLVSGLTPSTSGGSSTWTWTLPAHFPTGRYLRVTVTGGTLSQNGTPLTWDAHGYYEIALDAGSVTLGP